MKWNSLSYRKDGAGDGVRTRDVQLGKLAFFQLNYSRSIGTLNNSKYSRLCTTPKSASLRIQILTPESATFVFNHISEWHSCSTLRLDSKENARDTTEPQTPPQRSGRSKRGVPRCGSS